MSPTCYSRYEPTEEEIEDGCRDIQSQWDDRERYTRWLIAHSHAPLSELRGEIREYCEAS
jgi:hypothetical protein